MSTKSQIQTDINALGTGQLNTALELRTALNSLLGELFPERVTDTYTVLSTSRTITNSTISGLYYVLTFAKHGNRVFINGYISYSGATALPDDTDLITITNSLYQPINIVQYSGSDRTSPRVNFQNGKITLKGLALPTNVTLFLNDSYIVNN